MEEDWIGRCLLAAAAQRSINDATSNAVEKILRGDGGCRKLTGTEIATAAEALLKVKRVESLAEGKPAGGAVKEGDEPNGAAAPEGRQ